MELTLKRNSDELKSLRKEIKNIFGFNPKNIFLYQLALTPRFVEAFFSGEKISNERLEFLGDAVIDLIISQYLFSKFPYKDEGFLTEIRSRIVNTQYLSTIAKNIKLSEIAEKFIPVNHKTPPKNWLGNEFEAFIGAMFLDKGYDFCYDFFISYIVNKTLDIENIIEQKQNYKSQLIEYCQKNKLNIEFKSEKLDSGSDFKIKIFINNKLKGESTAPTIKQGEKDAAKIAYENIDK
ncbi:MAG: ribonuclease III [Bacteroidales bacterium]|nr:ribonuclease III [Bacteroidales bacterium]